MANEGGAFDWRTAPLPQADGKTLDGNIDGNLGGNLAGGLSGGSLGGGGLAYVLTVRDPLDRVLSHFRHEKASRPPKAYLRGLASFAAFVADPRFCHWKGDFYVRVLGGCGWAPQCDVGLILYLFHLE